MLMNFQEDLPLHKLIWESGELHSSFGKEKEEEVEEKNQNGQIHPSLGKLGSGNTLTGFYRLIKST